MSENAVTNLIERNSDTYKKLRASMFKAAAGRDMTTGSSVKTDKLKAEFWGDVQIPEGYFEQGVPKETSEAPPPVSAPPTEAPASAPVAPPTAPPVAPPSAAPVVASITPQAPVTPQQRIDEDKDAPTPEGAQQEPESADETPEVLERLEKDAAKSRELRESMTKNHQAQEAASEAVLSEKMTEMAEYAKADVNTTVLIAMTTALEKFTDAYRERTAFMRAQAMGVIHKPDDITEPEPRKEKKTPAAKKPQAPAAKKPTSKKPKKAASSPSGKKSSKASTDDVKPHPKYPKVQKDPCPWQPGTRGRPPKGVTRNKKTGEYKFPKNWQQINGKWHPPLK
jgi:hypothetical protein